MPDVTMTPTCHSRCMDRPPGVNLCRNCSTPVFHISYLLPRKTLPSTESTQIFQIDQTSEPPIPSCLSRGSRGERRDRTRLEGGWEVHNRAMRGECIACRQ